MAEELVGEVVSVDEESQQLIIAEKEKNHSDSKERLVTVKLPKHMVFRRPNGAMIPPWAGVGNKIRLRGYYSEDDPPLFIVTMIHHHFRGPGFDPTGVRSRIGKGCRPGFGMRKGHRFFRGKDEKQEKGQDQKQEKDSEPATEEAGK